MNRMALVFAGIFLTIVLIVPVYIFFTETAADSKDFNALGANPADQTQASDYYQAIAERHSTNLIILAIVEIVFVILFAVALWFALKA